MSEAERRTHRGRPVVTRAALMREANIGRALADAWYGHRAHNGHPGPVLAAGRSLYFDEAALLAWVRAQLEPPDAPARIVCGGRALITRRELARRTGLSEAALRDIYAHRVVTGHPEVVLRNGRDLYFEERAVLAWHAGRCDAQERRTRERVRRSW